MRVAPPQKDLLQFLQLTEKLVSCPCTMFTLAQIAPLTSGLCCCKPMRRTDCVVYAFIRLHCVCVSSSVVWLVYGQSTLWPKYIHMNRSVIYICHAQIYTSVTTQIYIYHDSNTHVFQCIHLSPRFPIQYVYLLQCAVCSTCRATSGLFEVGVRRMKVLRERKRPL